MKFLSVCDGIGAAAQAFMPLGWEPLAISEIDPFARAVLAHHHPGVPLHGDFRELIGAPWTVDADLVCGWRCRAHVWPGFLPADRVAPAPRPSPPAATPASRTDLFG